MRVANTVSDTSHKMFILKIGSTKLGLRGGQMGWKIANIVEMFSLHMNLFQFQSKFGQKIHWFGRILYYFGRDIKCEIVMRAFDLILKVMYPSSEYRWVVFAKSKHVIRVSLLREWQHNSPVWRMFACLTSLHTAAMTKKWKGILDTAQVVARTGQLQDHVGKDFESIPLIVLPSSSSSSSPSSLVGHPTQLIYISEIQIWMTKII